jgi:myo-inositol-1(or 4)-monophosphatase
VRRLGSAALDLCYVAAGRFDGFWEEQLHPWDIARVRSSCKEAGGWVTVIQRRTDRPLSRPDCRIEWPSAWPDALGDQLAEPVARVLYRLALYLLDSRTVLADS